MKIINGKLIFDSGVKSIGVHGDSISFHDDSNTEVIMDNKLIIRFYELLKFEYERSRSDDSPTWEVHCDEMFM